MKRDMFLKSDLLLKSSFPDCLGTWVEGVSSVSVVWVSFTENIAAIKEFVLFNQT